jgi:hypothetical protein
MEHSVTTSELPHDTPGLPKVRPASYAMEGTFLEVCDCFTVCPCWTDRMPDGGECTGAFAWVVEKGVVDGVDVSGRSAVSVSTHEGHRDGAKQRVMLFVDDGATETQAGVMAAAFSGRLGGPLAELSALLGELLGIERSAIEVQFGERSSRLTVGRRIAAESLSSIGSTGDKTTLANGRLSTVLGPVAEVAVAQRLKISMPGHGIDIDLKGRSAMRGPFRYENVVKDE